MSAKGQKLTAKQQAFVTAYLSNGRKGAEAYRTAYNTKAPPVRVANEASRLLRHPLIAPLIAEAKARASTAVAEVLNRYDVTEQRIVDELARLGFSNMQDYMRVGADGDPYLDWSSLTRDQAAALAEVTVEDFKDGRGEDTRDVRKVRFKLHDKRAALVDLARIRGYVVEKGGTEVKIGAVKFVIER